MGLYIIDFVAVVFIIAGFHIAFRQKLLKAWSARLGLHFASAMVQEATDDVEGIASVLRIAGVMIMAFSFTAGAFANLIAYYTRVGVN